MIKNFLSNIFSRPEKVATSPPPVTKTFTQPKPAPAPVKASTRLTIGSEGLELIKSFEGLKLTAYLCPARIPTIGYGHTKTVRADDVNKKKISEADAEKLLKADLVNFEDAVRKYVKVPLNQNQFDALVSFAFNVGGGALSKSTLLKKLNAKDYKGAADQFARWNKAGGKVLNGLARRRAAEAALFNKAVK